MTSKATIWGKRISRNSWFQHLLFWGLSFYVLARLFAYSDQLSAVDWIYTLLFHLSLFFVVYLNIRWLIPSVLQRGKIILYFFLSCLTLLSGVALNLATFRWLAEVLFPGYYFIGYYGFWDILEFMVVYHVVSSLMKFSKSWFEQARTLNELNRLEKEKLDAELTALKAQINPHFLFNSLNNLYSLALDRDRRTPDLILMLSGMMRYVLYETNVPEVPLEKEIEHLENYLELQEIRVGEQADIRFEVKGEAGEKQLAPLLFLPLVENGFKHGIKGDTEKSFIHVMLQIEPDYLLFKVENNKGDAGELEGRRSRGVGLQNIRRRLELIYPERYQLDVVDGIEVFTVILKIELP